MSNAVVPKLGDADALAVDCFMHVHSTISTHSISPRPGEVINNVYAASNIDDARMHAVTRVFDLLAICPAADPPSNLAQRTMRHIESAEGRAAALRLSAAEGDGVVA